MGYTKYDEAAFGLTLSGSVALAARPQRTAPSGALAAYLVSKGWHRRSEHMGSLR